MSSNFLPLTEALYAWLQANSLREPDVLRRLREETAATNHTRSWRFHRCRGNL
jgi:hypothetical protein